MLDRICIAVDGSDCARRATTVGLAIATAADASVDVVHVGSHEQADEGEEPDGAGDPVLEDLSTLLDDADCPVREHAPTGDPADRIVAFADERDADLLVLGRRGDAGLGERLLGSVVHAVLRTSDRPVLTVPEGQGAFEPSDLLVPTDGSDPAERVVPIAAELATRHGSTVHAVYALDLATVAGAFSAGGVTEAEIERYEAEGREHLDRLADRFEGERSGLSVRSAVVRDAPHAAIGDYVADEGVDLVVMGSHGETSALGQAFGSVTDRALRTVDVPVLVVTADGA